MKAVIKSGAERLLLWGGAARARRALLGGQVIVLAYHNVIPAGEEACGDRPLHVAQRQFADQLDALLLTHDVVPLASVLADGVAARRRPRAVITFDDAYRGAMTTGVEELARRGLPTTVFVAPYFVGDAPFWWDTFAGPEGLPPGFREHALLPLRGRDRAVREWALAAGHEAYALPPHARCATEEEIEAALRRHPDLTLGSHSWSHANLSALDPEDLHHELTRPLVWLRERFKAAIPWLSYPYGLASAAVRDATVAAGYQGAVRVDGRWLPAAIEDAHGLPRVDVSSAMSLAGFRLRTSGLFC